MKHRFSTFNRLVAMADLQTGYRFDRLAVVDLCEALEATHPILSQQIKHEAARLGLLGETNTKNERHHETKPSR